jgi:peptide/nickel transport system permease protein
MLSHIFTRLVQGLVTLLVVILVALALVRLSGDPAMFFLPSEATDEQRAEYRHKLHLDEPFPIQYIYYMANVAKGDFGMSLTHYEPSLTVVLRHVPPTLELTGVAILIALVIGFPIGVLAAIKMHSIFDYVCRIIVVLGQSIATFWLGMTLIMFFAVRLHWLPVSGRGSLSNIVLPSVTLAAWVAALIMRITRSSVLDVITQDYVRTARAKGLAGHVVLLRHILTNAMLPIVTVVALQFGALLGGALMTEIVFAWPGIGTLVLSSVETRDFPVIVATIVVVAVGVTIVNLFVDTLYGWIDPRVRLQ